MVRWIESAFAGVYVLRGVSVTPYVRVDFTAAGVVVRGMSEPKAFEDWFGALSRATGW
jgi:hypothetical protein